MKRDNPICFACSIFKSEVEEILKRGNFDMKCKYFSSMLHMAPDILDNKIESALKNHIKEDKKIVLLYGDCCPNMTNFQKNINVSRTQGINCIEILLGETEYKKLQKKGTFFLMPEWAKRWKEVFHYELKLKGKIATEFMQEFHTKIVYIDTGHQKIPEKQLSEIQEYSGLPVDIMKVDDSQLEKALARSIENLHKQFNQDES